MKHEAARIESRRQQFKEACRKAGVKSTQQRMAILEHVIQSRDHPDAETVFTGVRKSMPRISLDTVYRTLWLLRDLGLIHTTGLVNDRTRFDANLAPHNHFICSKCGEIRDFYCKEPDLFDIFSRSRSLESVKIFQINLYGLCRHCVEKTKQHKE